MTCPVCNDFPDTKYKIQETHTNNKASREFKETANINFIFIISKL